MLSVSVLLFIYATNIHCVSSLKQAYGNEDKKYGSIAEGAYSLRG